MKIALFSNINRVISKRSANALEKTGIAHKFAETKAVNKVVDKLQYLKFLMWFGIISTTIKDFFGMIFYYFQSLNNKKIPEEKRKYVASYEIASGLINCFMPLALGLTIQNKAVVDEITYRLFKKRYVDPQKLAKATGEELQKLLLDQKMYRTCRNGLGTFMAIVLATIVSKRMIAPFIAGPMASWYKKKYLTKADSKAGVNLESAVTVRRPAQPAISPQAPLVRPVVSRASIPPIKPQVLTLPQQPMAGPIPVIPPQVLMNTVAYLSTMPRPMPVQPLNPFSTQINLPQAAPKMLPRVL